MADETLQLEVTLENGKFKVASSQVAKSTKQMGDATAKAGKVAHGGFKKMTGGINLVKTAMKGFIGLQIVKTLYNVGKAALKSSADMEKNRIAFTTMLKSGEKAKTLLKDITAFSASTPFQLPGLIESSKQLIAFGVEQENIIETMRNLGNAAQGNQEVLGRLTLAYGKLKAKGKASLEELNMFTEAGVPIMQALADKFGVTTQAMFKMVSTGKVGFDDVNESLKNLTTGSGTFAGMLEKQSQSLSGMFSTLKDSIGLIILDLGDKLSPAFKNLIGSFASGTESSGIFAKAVGYIGKSIANVVNSISALVSGIAWLSNKTQEFYGRALRSYYEWQMNRIKGDKEVFQLSSDQQKAYRTYQDKFNAGRVAGIKLGKEKAVIENRLANIALDVLNVERGSAAEVVKTANLKKKMAKEELAQKAAAREQKKSQDEEDWEKLLADYDEKRRLLDEYQNYELTVSEWNRTHEQSQELKAANYHHKILKSKLGLDTKYAQGLATVMSTASVFMGEENRKLFRFGQVLAIGQTIMNTSQAIMKAWAMLAPFGAPAAAIIGAAGALQVRKIAGQKPPEPPKKSDAKIEAPKLREGTLSVPKDMPAYLHAGEAVVPPTMAESIRRGEASLSGGESGGGTTINVEGSIIDTEGLLEVVNEGRTEIAAEAGTQDFYGGSVYG
jgi:tape measure domain-containing protein